MHTYHLEDNPNDSATINKPKYVWDIARIFDPTTGFFDGYAISGTYVTSPTPSNTSSEVAVLRLDASSTPLWAKMYVNP